MKPHQIAELPPETIALAEKLNASCADNHLRQAAALIANVAEWNERTGGWQGVTLDCHSVRALHAHLSHHLRQG